MIGINTLALVHGDLVIDGTGNFAMFSGADRIRQDMTLALTENYGGDHFHPQWGSVLKNYLGNPITPQLQQLVKAEVNRVTQNYVVVQQNQVLRNTTYDIQGVFDTSDVVRSVDSIQVSPLLDTLHVSVSVSTLSRQTVVITRQIGP